MFIAQQLAYRLDIKDVYVLPTLRKGEDKSGVWFDTVLFYDLMRHIPNGAALIVVDDICDSGGTLRQIEEYISGERASLLRYYFVYTMRKNARFNQLNGSVHVAEHDAYMYYFWEPDFPWEDKI